MRASSRGTTTGVRIMYMAPLLRNGVFHGVAAVDSDTVILIVTVMVVGQQGR